jgi:hypothetical protein
MLRRSGARTLIYLCLGQSKFLLYLWLPVVLLDAHTAKLLNPRKVVDV